MVGSARGSQIGQQLNNRGLGNSGHPNRSANGTAFDKTADDFGAGRIV